MVGMIANACFSQSLKEESDNTLRQLAGKFAG